MRARTAPNTLEGTMTNTPNPIPTPEPSSTEQLPNRTPRRLGTMATVGIIAGFVAAAIGGVASAQTGGTTVVGQADEPTSIVVSQDELPDDAVIVEVDELDDLDDLDPAEKAIWDRFDQCLTDAGVDLEALEAAETEEEFEALDEAALDAAFESCESVLGELDDVFVDGMELDGLELSPEDEALFEQFDQCLTDAGVPMFDAEFTELDEADLENLGDLDDLDDGVAVETFEVDGAEAEAIDAAFESCEPILDGLSDSAMFMVDGGFCEEDHDA